MGVELSDVKKTWFDKVRNTKKRFDKQELVLKYCQNKEVLDIGCVGQDIDYNNPEWMHNRVKKIAKELIGVDIESYGIEKLKRMGFKVFHFHEMDLSRKFDVVLMLDVIEHVDNPVDFIQKYQAFLKKDGVMIITTPNANRAINFVNIFFRNDYPLNYEHTFWLCPKTFMELLERTGALEVKEFFWLNHQVLPANMNWKNRIIHFLEKSLVNFRSNFSPNFMFVLRWKR